MSKKHFNIRVKGKVQGVFFRVSAVTEAVKLGLKGFARNESDGSVYIEAEGDENSLNHFLKWCAVGPSSAVVESVSEEEGNLKNYSEFEIRR